MSAELARIAELEALLEISRAEVDNLRRKFEVEPTEKSFAAYEKHYKRGLGYRGNFLENLGDGRK